jgi:hypothetical protein
MTEKWLAENSFLPVILFLVLMMAERINCLWCSIENTMMPRFSANKKKLGTGFYGILC